jgi:hypothetical protein
MLMQNKKKNISVKNPSLVKSSSDFSHLCFYGDTFVFDTKFGMFYRLSPSASTLLRSFVNNNQIDDWVITLQKEYGISKVRAIRDIELFINDLIALGILEQSTAPLFSKENL